MIFSAMPPQVITAPLACLVQRFTYGPSDEHYRTIFDAVQASARSETWSSNERIAEKFASLENLRADWNAGESETPNPVTKLQARLIVEELLSKQLSPTAIMPSVEGGIGITIVRGERRGSIEILNSGEMVAATYESSGDPDVWEFESEKQSIIDTVEKISVYMSA